MFDIIEEKEEFMTTAAVQKQYTDLSGHFYEGQKREDVAEFTGLTSVFYDEKKEFDRIDSDHDGVLSRDEITAELEKDLTTQKLSKVLNTVTSICSMGLTILTKGRARFMWGLVTGINSISAYRSSMKQKEVEEKLSKKD